MSANPGEAAEDLLIFELENYLASEHPGCTIEQSNKPYKRADRAAVAKWVLEHIPGVTGRLITVNVGMLNGLLTRLSDIAGAKGLAMAQRTLKRMGYAVRFLGTNDDAMAMLAVPGTSAEEVTKASVAIMAALEGACKFYGIETNMGKMNISAFLSELNTITVAVKANGAMNVMLPGLRSLIGAMRRTPGFDWMEESFQASKSVTAGVKEGCDQTTCNVALAFQQYTHLQCCKMDRIALAQASGLPIPGDLPDMDASPASHLTGRPICRTYWSVFPGPAQAAAGIVERLMVNTTKTGVKISKKYGLTEEQLITRVCQAVAVSAIAQQCRVLSEYKYDAVLTTDLSKGFGPYSATLKGPPLQYDLGEHADGMLKPEFLKTMDFMKATSGMRNSIRHVIQAAFRTIINEKMNNAARLKNRIVQMVLVQANIAGSPPKGTVWDEKKDTSTLPKRLMIDRPSLNEDGTWGKVHGEVSFWWYMHFCARYDWEAELPIQAPLITVLISGMSVCVQTMLNASKHLATQTMGLVEGHQHTEYRSDMSVELNTHNLSALDLARLLDPSPVRAAAMELASLASRSQNADLRETDLSLLGNPTTHVQMSDLETIRQVSYTIDKHLQQGNVKGYLMPRIFPRPTLMDALIYHAIGKIGMNLSAHRISSIRMPLMKIDPVFTTITPDALDSHACSCIMAFIDAREREYMLSYMVLGQLPVSAGQSVQPENTLRGTSFKAMMIGFKVAATLGLTLSLSQLDIKILSTKEMNRETMVFLHARPGHAVRNVLGARFEPELTPRERSQRYQFRIANPDAPMPKRKLREDQITYVLCTEVLQTWEERVVLANGSAEYLMAYRYTQNVYTRMQKKDFEESKLQLVLNYKSRGKHIPLFINWQEVKDGTYSHRVAGRLIVIHWGCTYHATVACYPPHVCVAIVPSDAIGSYNIIPIAAIDCRQSIMRSEYEMPTVTPFKGTTIKYPTPKLLTNSIATLGSTSSNSSSSLSSSSNGGSLLSSSPSAQGQESSSAGPSRGISRLNPLAVTFNMNPSLRGDYQEETIQEAFFGESIRSPSTILHQSFIKHAGELAITTAPRTLAASIAAAFMVMTPWQAVREYVVAIMMHSGHLGDIDSEWCFSPNAVGNPLDILELNIDELTDKLVGDSSLLTAVMHARETSISALFFNTTIEAQIEQAIKWFRTDQYVERAAIANASVVAVRLHVKPDQTIEEELNEVAAIEVVLEDAEIDVNTGRQVFVRQQVPREIEPADPVYIHSYDDVKVSATVEAKGMDESTEDLDILEAIFNLGTRGDFDPESHDLDEETKGEEPATGEEADALEMILRGATQKAIKVSREVTNYGSTMGADGFQQIDESKQVQEDAYSGDFEVDELSIVMAESESVPYADKVDFRYELVNLNGTTASILGIMAAKAANLRGRMGGGYLVHKCRDMYGGLKANAEVQGYRWMRVPVTVWATMVDRQSSYSMTFKTSFLSEIQPPGEDAIGQKNFIRFGSSDTTAKTVGEMKEAGSIYSRSVSIMTDRFYKIGHVLQATSSQQSVVVSAAQQKIVTSGATWEVATSSNRGDRSLSRR
jgi:hypothetical protein